MKAQRDAPVDGVYPHVLREEQGAGHLRRQVGQVEHLLEQLSGIIKPIPPAVAVSQIKDLIDWDPAAVAENGHQAFPVQEHALKGGAAIQLVEAGQVLPEQRTFVQVEQTAAHLPVQDVHRLGKGIIFPAVGDADNLISFPHQYGVHSDPTSLPGAARLRFLIPQ